jgi:hypothetical protein
MSTRGRKKINEVEWFSTSNTGVEVEMLRLRRIASGVCHWNARVFLPESRSGPRFVGCIRWSEGKYRAI